MSRNEKSKILVCGDVNGKFKAVFTRADSINEKSGPFEFMLCVGNFFGSTTKTIESLNLSVPIPTYVLGPTSPDQTTLYPDINGCELCPNLNYLGKRGLFTTTTGLRIAYVSGADGSNQGHSQSHTFSENDVTSVRDICIRGQPNYKGIDILVTSAWPKDVTQGDNHPNKPDSNGSFLLSWLAAQIKPRYHFCSSRGYFYERPPYRNPSASGDPTEHATRFIALASVGNPDKHKWLYALSLQPIDQMKSSELYQHTTDETQCPYSGRMLLPNISKVQEEPAQFFYDMSAPADGDRRRKHKQDDDHPKKRQRPTFDQAKCWFCLASPDVEKHMVISIGNEAYLALAKGALVPEHVLILPVGHHQCLAQLPSSVAKEIEQFKSSLKKAFEKEEKAPVFFERNYKTSHLQIQVVPVVSRLIPRLKNAFMDAAEAEGLQLIEIPQHSELSQLAPPGTPYFYAELPDGERLFMRAKKNFPLQFGRDVLASESVLNMEDRADWKDCTLSKEEETDLTKRFRAMYEEFDFTLE